MQRLDDEVAGVGLDAVRIRLVLSGLGDCRVRSTCGGAARSRCDLLADGRGPSGVAIGPGPQGGDHGAEGDDCGDDVVRQSEWSQHDLGQKVQRGQDINGAHRRDQQVEDDPARVPGAGGRLGDRSGPRGRTTARSGRVGDGRWMVGGRRQGIRSCRNKIGARRWWKRCPSVRVQLRRIPPEVRCLPPPRSWICADVFHVGPLLPPNLRVHGNEGNERSHLARWNGER